MCVRKNSQSIQRIHSPTNIIILALNLHKIIKKKAIFRLTRAPQLRIEHALTEFRAT